MKLCNTCKLEKEFSEFNKRLKASDGLQNQCRECLNKSNRKRRQKMTALIGRWKTMKGCSEENCQGHPKHRAALHLAHIEPEIKHHKHSGAYKAWWSKERVKEELAKCRILCANCHAVETFDEGHYLLGNRRDGLHYENE